MSEKPEVINFSFIYLTRVIRYGVSGIDVKLMIMVVVVVVVVV